MKYIIMTMSVIFGLIIGIYIGSQQTIVHSIYDHSDCQYPYRTTNPANGCDNTDPCDPANTKGGSGDCSKTIEPSPAPIKITRPIITEPKKPTLVCEYK